MLRRKAVEWRAIGEEHCDENDPIRFFYRAIEFSLREVANALDTTVSPDERAEASVG